VKYLHLRSVIYEVEPFPHIVIDNVFSDEAYLSLEKYLKEKRGAGFAHIQNFERFFPFTSVYEKLG
jgi:hypothetical protein